MRCCARILSALTTILRNFQQRKSRPIRPTRTWPYRAGPPSHNQMRAASASIRGARAIIATTATKRSKTLCATRPPVLWTRTSSAKAVPSRTRSLCSHLSPLTIRVSYKKRATRQGSTAFCRVAVRRPVLRTIPAALRPRRPHAVRCMPQARAADPEVTWLSVDRAFMRPPRQCRCRAPRRRSQLQHRAPSRASRDEPLRFWWLLPRIGEFAGTGRRSRPLVASASNRAGDDEGVNGGRGEREIHRPGHRRPLSAPPCLIYQVSQIDQAQRLSVVQWLRVP